MSDGRVLLLCTGETVKKNKRLMRMIGYQLFENACYIFLRQVFDGEDGWEVKRTYVDDNGVFVCEVDTNRPFSTKELLLFAKSDVMIHYENGLYIFRINPSEEWKNE